MSTLPLELGQVSDPTARRAFEQISLRWPRLPDLSVYAKKPIVYSGASLPAGVDGDEVYYQNAAMAALGVAWRFRYNAASVSAYKWEFVGGSAFYALGATASTGSASYVDVGGVHGVTCPLTGEFTAEWGTPTTYNGTAGAFNYMGLHFGAVTQMEAQFYVAAANAMTALYAKSEFAITAATVVSAKLHVSTGTGAFQNRYMAITPIRVA